MPAFIPPAHSVYPWHNAPTTDTPLDKAHLDAAATDLVGYTQNAVTALATYLQAELTGLPYDANGAAASEQTRALAAEALRAPLASPALTGNPTAPTQTTSDSSTKLATTAFVHAVGGGGGGGSTTGVFKVYNVVTDFSADNTGVADSTAAEISAISTAVGAGGGIVYYPPGVYLRNSAPPQIPKNLTKQLHILGAGQGATTIKLTSGGPRAFDFDSTAAGDTLGNVEFSDMTIDANNVDTADHTLIGTRVAGGSNPNAGNNFKNIFCRRVRIINMPSGITTLRLGIGLEVRQLNAGGPVTQNTVTNIRIEDTEFNGGASAIFLNTSSQTGISTVFFDNIIIRNCQHYRTSAPSGFGYQSCIQIGSGGYGRSVRIDNFYGQYSGDVGIEIDNITDCVISNSRIDDCYNECFFYTNIIPFSSTNMDVNEQRCVWDNCSAYNLTNVNPGGQRAFCISSPGTAYPIGEIIAQNCRYYRATTGMHTSGEAFYCQIAAGNPTPTAIRVESFSALADGITGAGGGTQSEMIHIGFDTTARCVLDFKDINTTYIGALTSGSALYYHAEIACSATSLTIDGWNVDHRVTNNPAASTWVAGVIVNGAPTHPLGTASIRRVVMLPTTATPLIGIALGTSANYAQHVDILDCELSASSQPIYVTDATVWAKANVHHTFPMPAPSDITAGASTVGFTISDGYAGTVVITGGAVTKVEWSPDGSTYYQVGADTFMAFAVRNNDYVKLTYASILGGVDVAVPTVTKIAGY